MDRLLNVMTGFSVLLIGLVLLSVRRAHIRVEYSVSWLAAALVLLALSRSRALLDRIGGGMGITAGGLDVAPVTLLVVTGALFLLVLYRLSMMISSLKDSNIALAQRLAILEFRLESHEEAKTKRS
jgi:hypothetical protein